MPASALDIQRLRKMVAEDDSATYSDEELAAYIERYPRTDAGGYEPFLDATVYPAQQVVNPDWTETYDLAAAAADVWSEKAGAAASRFNFTTDGQTFNVQQIHENCLRMARHFAARRSPSTVTLRSAPDPRFDLRATRFQYADPN